MTTFIVLFVLLRSVVLPIKALAMNTLSIVASFGALVWIFQDGNLSQLLGFQPLGFVETTQPVILFCVLFGLSMDYEVFLLSRMKEVWDRTGDNTEAVARGLERSGRIVSSAALIVVVVAGSFAFADIVLIKALGLGVAIAVALDATVVRALLVPATMRLLGKWNWWVPRGSTRALQPILPRTEAEVEAARPMTDPLAPRRPPALAARPARRSSSGALLRPGPREPGRRPAGRHARAERRPPRPPDPQPVELPRDDGPHDRLTEWWYYTGHLARRRRHPARVRVRRVPGRARRVPGVVGVAPRPDRRDRRPASTTRSAPRSGRRSTARRATTTAADGLRVHGRGPGPDRAHAARRDRRGRWPDRWARTGSAALARGAEVGGRPRRRPSGSTSRSRAASRRRSTTRTARSTSATPAARTTTRGPR